MDGLGAKYTWLLLLIGGALGGSGEAVTLKETLETWELYLSLTLKGTGILSFIIYLILNWKNIWKTLRGSKKQ